MKRRELSVKWVVRDVIQSIGIQEYGASAIRGPADLRAYLAPWAGEIQEVAVVLLLNSRMKIIGHKECGRGSSTSCPMDISAVFRAAVAGGAAAVIVSHNHPSGDPTPSGEDIEVTQKLMAAGEILEIPVLDHIITCLAPDGSIISTSLKENGHMSV